MKRQLMTGLFAALAFTAVAQSNEWRDPEVNAVNRAPMHANFFAYETAEVAAKDAKEQSQNFMTLNGPWKFFWVKNADARPTDFWRTDYNDKGWNNMPVPGVWELNGYGDPLYVNVGYAWREQFKNNPPEVPTVNNHVGSYRREIMVPASWNGKEIIAHFGSVTSYCTLKSSLLAFNVRIVSGINTITVLRRISHRLKSTDIFAVPL